MPEIKRCELLAPAGDFACFKAAVNAGADAVYLGGAMFGARAYASNFSEEEILEAISYAHLFGIKVYLTVNTLVKEQEMPLLVPFLTPFYEAGLDGVIVQDFGVLKVCKEQFPALSLHASTQMCVASPYGASLLKDYGVSRVVPARELSLEELKEIRARGVEVEAFIHGAMCYAYSGQCLFSSFLGGRSGNRGRCAGSCRLPYSFGSQKEEYPLSLKDMCTVTCLDRLLDAGIDSFKIEGRMKNPYYVAGVTSIYRKYMDRYYEDPSHYAVEDEDLELLKKLYIRSERSEGYFFRHNGKEMVSLKNPAYKSAEEEAFRPIRDRYLDRDRKVHLRAAFTAALGEKPALSLTGPGEVTVCVRGNEEVSEAKTHPATKEDVKKQIAKTGNTPFLFDEISVIIKGGVFLPVRLLNDLRRDALSLMQKTLSQVPSNRQSSLKQKDCASDDRSGGFAFRDEVGASEIDGQTGHATVVFVETAGQLEHVIRMQERTGMPMILQLRYSILSDPDAAALLRKGKEQKIPLELALPRVMRLRAARYLDRELSEEKLSLFDGIAVNTLDGLSYASERIKKAGSHHSITGCFGLYVTNTEALRFLKSLGIRRYTSSPELNDREQRSIADLLPRDVMVYGHIPFMQTAGCIKKTYDLCDHESGWQFLTDRMKKKLPVRNDCVLCENTIYNSVPLSLHDHYDTFTDCNPMFYFTTEKNPWAVLSAFENGEVPCAEYTKGHYKKGME